MGRGASLRDREQLLSDLIGDIYTAPTDPSCWRSVVKQIVDATGGTSGQLVSPSKNAMSELWAPHGFGSDEMAPYASHYHLRDLWTQGAAALGLPVCTVLTGERLVEPSSFMNSEFYNDFLRPCEIERLLTCVIETGDGDTVPKTSLSVYRPPGSQPFDEETTSFLGIVAPHVRRAIHLHRHIAGLEHRNATNTAVLEELAVGVVLIDETYDVAYCNPSAAAALRENDGLSVSDGRLIAMDPEQNAQLEGALRDAAQLRPSLGKARMGPMMISRVSGQSAYRVSVVPLPAPGAFPVGRHRIAAIVFIADSSPRMDAGVSILSDIYGLTAAEAKLVRKLAAGQSPKQIAKSLSLSVNTVRTQLSAVFGKTGTHRQPQLIRLIVTLADLQRGR